MQISNIFLFRLGPESKSREDWLLQNTEMSKVLYDLDGSQLILIADGTYLYCEKSENSCIQRKL
jgi:hypothetical protein